MALPHFGLRITGPIILLLLHLMQPSGSTLQGVESRRTIQHIKDSMFQDFEHRIHDPTSRDRQRMELTAPATTENGVDQNLFNRIVGGTDADPTQFPWFAFLFIQKRFDDGRVGTVGCGGSLIHSDMVLTAAHCFSDTATREVLSVTVIVNRTMATSRPSASETEFEYQRAVERYTLHPDYDPIEKSNDVAIVLLRNPVLEVTPLVVNRNEALPADNENVQVVGMGLLGEEEGALLAESLQVVTLQTTPMPTCRGEIAQPQLSLELQLCAKAPGKDACGGDSGGPLLLVQMQDVGATLPPIRVVRQVGIVSFGIGCARPNLSGVYTRVSGYIEFIDRQICQQSVNTPPKYVCEPFLDVPTSSPSEMLPSPSNNLVPNLDIPAFNPSNTNTNGDSRAIQITKSGIVIATSSQQGPLRIETTNGRDYTVGLPTVLDSMDDLSISNEGFLFGLSIDTPALCSFGIMKVEGPVVPISCITGEWSQLPFAGISAGDGLVVISGGEGGMTVVKYNTTNGMLDPILACLNCSVDDSVAMWTDVCLMQRPNRVPLAAMSTVWDDQSAGTMIIDLESFTEVHRFVHDVFLGPNLAVARTNYPLESEFYYEPQFDRHCMYTAHGTINVYEFTADSTSQTAVDVPERGFLATTLSVDELNGVLVVGGLIDNKDSVILVYDIADSPVAPKLRVSSAVAGKVLSVAANGGKVAYVTSQFPSIVIFDTNGSPLPSSIPSLVPSAVPSVIPSSTPSGTPSMQPSDTLPTNLPADSILDDASSVSSALGSKCTSLITATILFVRLLL